MSTRTRWLRNFAAMLTPVLAHAQKKPNILVIFGDDIGITTISAYSDGLMGYETPNIDRLAREGIRFLHYYGGQSCTAGRAAFLTGQHGIRTGLTKVGFPGAPMGMSQLDPSIGGLLKRLGYGAAQFGKHHVGDRNETLPTVNGFDEFFGNLYLNAEEEPELPDYPKDPAYRAKFGPRGVLHTKATDRDDPTVDPRFGKIGKQTIEDTGPLMKKRMETIDDETSAAVVPAELRPQYGHGRDSRRHPGYAEDTVKEADVGDAGSRITPEEIVRAADRQHERLTQHVKRARAPTPAARG